MKGMILAAGYGTRMGPISRYLAKPAVPFLGVPMIEHSIGVLRSGGIKEIVINVHHMPETITELLGDGSRLGVAIEYSYEDPILGSGGGIGKVRDFFEGKTFVVFNSDVMIDLDLNDVIDAHKGSDADATLLLRPDPTGSYGKVVVDETGRIRKIEGNPQRIDFYGGTDYMFAGLHVIEPIWFDYAPEDRDIYESFPDVYGPMLEDGRKINSFVHENRWIDLGSASRLLDATIDGLVGNLVPNPCRVPKSTDLKNSVLTGQTKVGEDCTLRGIVCLGPAVIGNGCNINHSILCPGAEIPEGTEAEHVVFYEQTSTPLNELSG
jgi:mannose-1-phosphate guanylyltransferase